jgi:hypothetical protein
MEVAPFCFWPTAKEIKFKDRIIVAVRRQVITIITESVLADMNIYIVYTHILYIGFETRKIMVGGIRFESQLGNNRT